MHRFALLALLVALPLAGRASQVATPLTNENIVSMVKNALPEDVVLNAIQASDPQFDLSADALIALKNAGVSSTIMKAMIAAATNKKTPTPPGGGNGAQMLAGTPNGGLTGLLGAMKAVLGGDGAGALAGLGAGAALSGGGPGGSQPSVALLEGSTRNELAPEKTFVAETKSTANTLKRLAVDTSIRTGLQAGANQMWYQAVTHFGSGVGGSIASDVIGQASSELMVHALTHRSKPSSTYVWALSGTSSSTTAGSKTPDLDVNYAAVPGINPGEFEPAIVRLTPSHDSWRLVGATQAKAETVESGAPEWQVYSSFIEDRVPAHVQKLASGHARISPDAALDSGEYAVVLRPSSKAKKFSGVDVAQNRGDGLLFNSAWSFSVK